MYMKSVAGDVGGVAMNAMSGMVGAWNAPKDAFEAGGQFGKGEYAKGTGAALSALGNASQAIGGMAAGVEMLAPGLMGATAKLGPAGYLITTGVDAARSMIDPEYAKTQREDMRVDITKRSTLSKLGYAANIVMKPFSAARSLYEEGRLLANTQTQIQQTQREGNEMKALATLRASRASNVQSAKIKKMQAFKTKRALQLQQAGIGF